MGGLETTSPRWYRAKEFGRLLPRATRPGPLKLPSAAISPIGFPFEYGGTHFVSRPPDFENEKKEKTHTQWQSATGVLLYIGLFRHGDESILT